MAVIYLSFVLSVCLYSGTARESTQTICASCPFDFLVMICGVRDMKLVYRTVVRSVTRGSSHSRSLC